MTSRTFLAILTTAYSLSAPVAAAAQAIEIAPAWRVTTKQRTPAPSVSSYVPSSAVAAGGPHQPVPTKDFVEVAAKPTPAPVVAPPAATAVSAPTKPTTAPSPAQAGSAQPAGGSRLDFLFGRGDRP